MISVTQNYFLSKLPSTVPVKNNELWTVEAYYLLLYFICHRSKKCLIFFCFSLMYFLMDVCLISYQSSVLQSTTKEMCHAVLKPVGLHSWAAYCNILLKNRGMCLTSVA